MKSAEELITEAVQHVVEKKGDIVFSMGNGITFLVYPPDADVYDAPYIDDEVVAEHQLDWGTSIAQFIRNMQKAIAFLNKYKNHVVYCDVD